MYGRSITAPSPIPSHVFNAHRRQSVTPSPSPASFVGSSVSGASSQSPITVNDRAINYNPSHGFYEEDSNNTGFSDQSDFSQNYSHYGTYGGNTVLPNQGGGGGNNTFAPIQPGESNVSIMNNQLEMLGIKSGDTFNLSNHCAGGAAGVVPPQNNKESTLLKSYLVDQTNPNLSKSNATTTTTAMTVPAKIDGERTVQLVTPQHLPASEFLRNQAKISSRTKVETGPDKINDFYNWNHHHQHHAHNNIPENNKKNSSQVPTPPSSLTASPPDQRLEQDLAALCGQNPVNNYASKESPSDHPVLTPDTDTPLTPLGGAGDCLGVHQLGDNLLEELQGFS